MRNRLTAVAIKKAADGKLEDGGGLRLVKKGGRGKWVFRCSHLGKRREMGLGAWPDLALSVARSSRDSWARELAAGHDPIALRDARKADANAEREKADPPMADAVTMVFDAKRAMLRGDGKRGRWMSPMSLYVVPAIGAKPLSQISTADIVSTFRPIWRTKPPTALKAIRRMRLVFEEMRLMGFDCDPFTVDAPRRQLGAVSHKPQPMASTPWQDMPDLYGTLKPGFASHDRLRWLMLTCVRMEAARHASYEEIEGNVWTVPRDRVKGTESTAQAFRVPLSSKAVALAAECAPFGKMLFPGQRGGAVTNAAVVKAMRNTKLPGVPHGFRSSFRSWAQDHEIAWDVSETILGHAVGSRLERTYARSDLLDRRRVAMQSWADFITSKA